MLITHFNGTIVVCICIYIYIYSSLQMYMCENGFFPFFLQVIIYFCFELIVFRGAEMK